jgi:hypothetical protein
MTGVARSSVELARGPAERPAILAAAAGEESAPAQLGERLRLVPAAALEITADDVAGRERHEAGAASFCDRSIVPADQPAEARSLAVGLASDVAGQGRGHAMARPAVGDHADL